MSKRQAKKLTVSKQQLAERAYDLSEDAIDTGVAGLTDLEEGEEMLDVAGAAAGVAVDATVAAASDLTRAQDADLVAGRLQSLSDVVAAAGVNDLLQGVDLISASEDVDAMSAVVGLMSREDLDKGLELARLAGELETISNVADLLEMPVLSYFLSERGATLQEIAIDTILRAAATRSLSHMLAATGAEIGAMGEDEMDEGAVRLVAAEIGQQRSKELAAASGKLAQRGMREVNVAGTAASTARHAMRSGVAQAELGSAEIGAAVAMDDMAENIEDLAESMDD